MLICLTFFQKVLKNLYENTALHEKIAANINRSLCSHGKAASMPEITSEGSGGPSGMGSLRRIKEVSNDSWRELGIMDTRRKDCMGEANAEVGGPALYSNMSELISKTTADPAFDSLLDEVFGKLINNHVQYV